MNYKAKVISVHDGDTFTAQVSLGFNVYIVAPVRVRGINAPELNTREGIAAKMFAGNMLSPGREIELRTESRQFDKYGRLLAEVWIGDKSFGDIMVQTRNAVQYLMSEPPPEASGFYNEIGSLE